MAAADSNAPLGYDAVAQATGLTYELAAHQIGQLAEGRVGQPGARLLTRVAVDNSRFKRVRPSRIGSAVAKRFVPVTEAEEVRRAGRDCQLRLAAFLRESTLPGLNVVHNALPGISLGTLSVLLYCLTHQDDFWFDGLPAKQIVKELGVSNLNRHLTLLTQGKEDWPVKEIVAATPNKRNSRFILPDLTDDGHRLISRIAAAVIGEPPVTPRRPKPARLEELPSREDMKDLRDEDYDDIS